MLNVALMIPMAGIPCQRPRSTVVNGYAHVYVPQKTKDFEKKIGEHYREATGGYRYPDDAALIVTITFSYKPPRSISKVKAKKMIDGEINYLKKPDLDNLAKAVLDGLNGIAFKDDAQIVRLNVSKEYGREDRIFISIRESERG